MTKTDFEKFAGVLSMIAVIAAVAGNLLFLFLDRSDQASGYDHEGYNTVLYLHDLFHTDEQHVRFFGHGHPFTLLYFLSLYPTLAFGLSPATLMAAPFFGLGLVLFFGFKIGRKLGGNASAGWMTAAALALTPFIFGTARKFCPWPLVVGLYLVFIFACLRYQENPGTSRAWSIAATVLVGMTAPHDATTQLLFGFYCVLPAAWVLRGAVVFQSINGKTAFKHAAAIAGLPLAGCLLPSSIWARPAVYSYLAEEASRFEHARSFASSLPGYLLDMFFNSFLPGGFLLLFIGALALPFAVERKKSVLTVIPVVYLAALSLLVKKNNWYIFEILALFPVAAALAANALFSRLKPRLAATLFTAWIGILLGQYALASLSFSFDLKTTTNNAMDITIPAYSTLDSSAQSNSYRNRIAEFTFRQGQLFPKSEEINLGIVVDATEGFNLVPFYLRTSRRPLNIHLAALPCPPKNEKGPDAVLFVPNLRLSAGPPESDPLFFHYYAEEIFDRMKEIMPDCPAPDELSFRELFDSGHDRLDLPGSMTLIFADSKP